MILFGETNSQDHHLKISFKKMVDLVKCPKRVLIRIIPGIFNIYLSTLERAFIKKRYQKKANNYGIS